MLPKLIVLVGLVVLVWKAFKFGALHQQRQAARDAGISGGAAPRAARAANGPETRAQDLHRCPSCDAYVAPGSAPCGRGDCPQRR